MAFTVICTLIADSVPKKMRGLAMGRHNTSASAGMLTCSLGMGVGIRKYGFQAGFSLTGAVVRCMLLLFNVLYHQAQTLFYRPQEAHSESIARPVGVPLQEVDFVARVDQQEAGNQKQKTAQG